MAALGEVVILAGLLWLTILNPQATPKASLDPPPKVRIIGLNENITLAADDSVRGHYEAMDNSGLKSVRVEVLVEKKVLRVIHLWLEEKPKKIVKGAFLIDLRSHRLASGDMLTYRVVARAIKTNHNTSKSGASPFHKVLISSNAPATPALPQRISGEDGAAMVLVPAG